MEINSFPLQISLSDKPGLIPIDFPIKVLCILLPATPNGLLSLGKRDQTKHLLLHQRIHFFSMALVHAPFSKLATACLKDSGYLVAVIAQRRDVLPEERCSRTLSAMNVYQMGFVQIRILTRGSGGSGGGSVHFPVVEVMVACEVEVIQKFVRPGVLLRLRQAV